MNANSSRRPLTNDERQALEQFARLEISIEDLRHRLSGVMEFDFQSEHKRLEPYFDPPEPGIRIEKWHLDNALDKRRHGQITTQELADWASMLQMNEAYQWCETDEDEIAEWLWTLANDIPDTEEK